MGLEHILSSNRVSVLREDLFLGAQGDVKMGAGVIGLISFGGVLATEVVVVTCPEGR